MTASIIEVQGRPIVGRTTAGASDLPLVVLLHGSGSGAGVWDEVRRRVDGRLATLTYDRPARADRRRPVTASELAEDLSALLQAGGWQPPYLLVGHSWGGVVARTFAQAFPGHVAGLVLVDATHEGLRSLRSWRFRLAQRLAGGGSRLPFAGGQVLATAREVAGIPSSLGQLRAPALPTWTLVGGHADTAAHRAVREDFLDTYGRLDRSSTLVRHRVVRTAGHDLPLSAPDAVVAALEEALAFVKEGARR